MSENQNVIKLTVRNSAAQNRKVLESIEAKTQNMKELRESIKRSIGLDIFVKAKLPASDPNFSLADAKKKLVEAANISGFPQLARAGVQVAYNDLVQAYTDTTYEEFAHVQPSKMDTELYAPLHGLSFLSERGPGQKYSEATIAGLDLKLKNRNFGEILSIEDNLLDDDQTGQLAQLTGDLAEWTKLLYEVYCYAKLGSAAGSNYGGLSIPQSETYSTAPWSTSLSGGGANRPSAFGAMTQANIKSGIQALYNQKNLLGLKMVVKPSGLIVSPLYMFDAMVLMQSTNNPSVQPASAGATGGTFSINPVKSILNVITSRFVVDNSGSASGLSSAWYIVDQSKPWFVLQLRDPGSVVMENPNSGESFDRGLNRHKLNIRSNADFIDPRFAWQGSDGSV